MFGRDAERAQVEQVLDAAAPAPAGIAIEAPRESGRPPCECGRGERAPPGLPRARGGAFGARCAARLRGAGRSVRTAARGGSRWAVEPAAPSGGRLALGAEAPDREIAEALERASHAAAVRGAPEVAGGNPLYALAIADELGSSGLRVSNDRGLTRRGCMPRAAVSWPRPVTRCSARSTWRRRAGTCSSSREQRSFWRVSSCGAAHRSRRTDA